MRPGLRACAGVVAVCLAAPSALAIRPYREREPASEPDGVAIPEGFEALPVSSPGQVAIARKGDVYFVVQDAARRLAIESDPVVVTEELLGPQGETTGKWQLLGAAPVIRFVRHADELHWVGVIGSRGPAALRMGVCQTGVGLKKEARAPREQAVDACLAALEQLPGLRPPDQPPLPFTPPPGFLRGLGRDDTIYWGVRPGAGPGRDLLLASDLAAPLEVSSDLQRTTETLDELMGKGKVMQLNVVAVEQIGGVDVVRYAGKMSLHPLGDLAVTGFVLPRGRRTLVLSSLQKDAVTEEMERMVRAVAESTQGIASASSASGAADAGPPRPKDAWAEDEGDGWKGALLVTGLAGAAILLAFVFAITSRRGRRRKGV